MSQAPHLQPEPTGGLPSLREDLMLMPSTTNKDGSPTWVIQDPVRNKFFKIGWLEFELLARWQSDPQALLEQLIADTTLRPALSEVMALGQFLQREHLTQWSQAKDLQAARMTPKRPGIGHWQWWLHNYLFFRIPLTRPDRLLQSSLAHLRWLCSPVSVLFLLLASGLGLLLAARQGEVFAQTFVDSLTLSGFLGFALALMLAKILHELGHAYVATAYGIRVAHMGVAFLVLWPMLYTDTSESWRLRHRLQRLHVAIAGIAVEASLAGLSLLGWAIAPPGAAKSAFFYLATTSLIMTLALNLSPFMRFDGYFVLSDALNLPNLHERSSALARTWLRRLVLGWSEPWPEALPGRARLALICFALGTWLYRLFLFLGIAVAVYLMFFKALGLFLFAVEMVWFIARPIYREMSVWVRRRENTQAGRASLWLLLLLAVLALLAWPRAHQVQAQAQLRAEHRTIYSPLSGQVMALKAAGPVKAGEPLVILNSPKLQSDALRAQINTEASRAALVSAELTSESRGDQIGKLGQDVQQFMAENRAAGKELARLHLNAEFAGQWTDIEPTLTPGSWVRPQDVLGTLVDESRWVVEAWVDEADLQALKVSASGKFYPANHIDRALAVRLVEIDSVRAASLPHPGLSTDHGGSLTTTNENRQLVPRNSLYRIKLEVLNPPEQKRWTRGRISIEGERYSLLWRGIRYSLAALIRESGF
jgi:putative peptide zinc metalloprotease protein